MAACEACKFWQPKEAGITQGWGICHRHAPQPAPGESPRYCQPGATWKDYWCGEFAVPSDEIEF